MILHLQLVIVFTVREEFKMSERQARLKRKNLTDDVILPKKRTKADILTNVVIVLIVVVLVGVGALAIYNEYSQKAAEQATTETQQEIPTIGQYAESMGLTADAFLEEYGLNNTTEVSIDTKINDAIQYMTLGNYAKFGGMDISEVKESLKIDASVNENTLMSEIYEMLSQNAQSAVKESE